MPGIAALAASLEWLNQLGIERISNRILDLTSFLCSRLESVGAIVASDRRPEHSSGIVSFSLPERPPREVQRDCRHRGVVINSRDGRLRASPHAYSSAGDIERLIDVLT